MRWMTLLPMLAAVAAAGCVEPPKPAATPQSAPPEATPPAKSDRPPVPDEGDPVVRAAELSAQRVAALEEAIDDALTAVADDLQLLTAGDHGALDLTAEKLLAVVRPLRQSGTRIVERYPKVKADLAGIAKAAGHVKVGYGRARELYLEKAKAESGTIRERYETLAELCDTFARTNDERAAKYAAFAKELSQAVAKVERHVAFLADFETFLALNPAAKGAKDRDEFLSALNTFTQQTLRLGDALRQFRDRVRSGAVSRRLQAEHDRAIAAPIPAPRLVAAVPPETAPRPKEPEVAPVPAPPPAPIREAVPAPPPPVAKVPAPPAVVRETKASPVAPVRPSVVTAAGPPPPRVVPVTVTRCVPVLVPVACCQVQRGLLGRVRTVVTTRYEWRSQSVTETRYLACH